MTIHRSCILLLAFALAGCAPYSIPQLSRDEWIALKTRTYPGVPVTAAYDAAERILRLADPKDVTASYDAAGRLRLVRAWMIYTGVAFVGVRTGQDVWLVEAVPAADGTQITVTASGDLGVPDDPALYRLFWARMDYLLGRTATWTTCEDAAGWPNGKADMPLLLCNPMFVEDLAPNATVAPGRVTAPPARGATP